MMTFSLLKTRHHGQTAASCVVKMSAIRGCVLSISSLQCWMILAAFLLVSAAAAAVVPSAQSDI